MEIIKTEKTEEKKMSEMDLAFFKNLLLKRREIAVENLDYLKKIIEDSTPSNRYTFHMADQGTDAMEREKNFSFLTRQRIYLKKIDAALERIEQGTYGICKITGQIIDYNRLKAVPTTTISIEAKKTAENNGNGRW